MQNNYILLIDQQKLIHLLVEGMLDYINLPFDLLSQTNGKEGLAALEKQGQQIHFVFLAPEAPFSQKFLANFQAAWAENRQEKILYLLTSGENKQLSFSPEDYPCIASFIPKSLLLVTLKNLLRTYYAEGQLIS